MSLHTLVADCLGERDAVALAKERAPIWMPLAQPIKGHSEVGGDPGYDDDFQRMREEVNKLSGANIDQIIELGETLLTHTCKDLRVATYYLWARLQKAGEEGFADGLSLLAALVERYDVAVLPARPNSRRMALEWLASDKVLGILSRFPEVAKGEAERTVAALVWLEKGLGAWPVEQRPNLQPLYTALASRLARAGGVDAVVPQHTLTRDAPEQANGACLGEIKSGRDLLDNGRMLAIYLREQPTGWLAAHRLMKSLRWDTVHQSPAQDANGNSRLAPPRSEYRAQLKRLYLQQSWGELLDQCERMYAEGVNHFWLDLQWFLYQALSKQTTSMNQWADIVKRDLAMFLKRMPGIEALRWNDGSPFADEVTSDWIAQSVNGHDIQSWIPAPTVQLTADPDVLLLESEALAQADAQGVEHALSWLAARPDIHNARQHWLLRLLMARVAEQYGKSELAIHLLSELDVVAQRHELDRWEPSLNFEVKARLLKLLRTKAQRGDSDKSLLARRMEPLLAALVAIDPVRAAVLCS